MNTVGVVSALDDSHTTVMEEECMRKAGVSLTLRVPTNVANYIHNQKRGDLLQIDDCVGPIAARPQLNDQIGAPGERFRAGGAKHADSLID